MMLGDVVEARAAPVRVVAGGAPADQSHHRRCGGEGRARSRQRGPCGKSRKIRRLRRSLRLPTVEVVPECLIARIGRRLLIAHGIVHLHRGERPSPLASRNRRWHGSHLPTVVDPAGGESRGSRWHAASLATASLLANWRARISSIGYCAMTDEFCRMPRSGNRCPALPTRFPIGIGVTIGDVAGGWLGPEECVEYSVVGDAVNLVERIHAQAGPGDVALTRQRMSRSSRARGQSLCPAACQRTRSNRRRIPERDAGDPLTAERLRRSKRADNSTLYAPPPTLGLHRIGRDSPKSAALIR